MCRFDSWCLTFPAIFSHIIKKKKKRLYLSSENIICTTRVATEDSGKRNRVKKKKTIISRRLTHRSRQTRPAILNVFRARVSLYTLFVVIEWFFLRFHAFVGFSRPNGVANTRCFLTDTHAARAARRFGKLIASLEYQSFVLGVCLTRTARLRAHTPRFEWRSSAAGLNLKTKKTLRNRRDVCRRSFKPNLP